MTKISIVSTLYKSAPYVKEFCSRITDAVKDLGGWHYEIILVDDGSPDASLSIAKALAAEDSHITVIELSKNFGHHQAMMTGLTHSEGDFVYLLDSDLEEEPEWLSRFYTVMQEAESDVVFGVQAERRGRFFDRLIGRFYYKLFRALTLIDQPDNIITARLMTKNYVDSLLLHSEREVSIGGLWAITGFKQTACKVVKRNTSQTTYSLARRVKTLVDAITSFSSQPLIFTFYTGIFISLTAVLYIVYLVLRYAFISTPPDGYTSLIASIWLFSGLVIFFLGLQGIYIAKIFVEVKQRPLTIVRKIHTSKNTDFTQTDVMAKSHK